MILETALADITKRTSTPPTEQLLPQQIQQGNDSNPTFTMDEHQNNDNNSGSYFKFNGDQKLLNDRIRKFYNVCINKPLEERNYDIKKLQRITKDEWQILNYIIELFTKSNCIFLDLWNINVIQYCVILAVLEKNNSVNKGEKPSS